MSEESKMEHGDFCWDELMSTDPSAAAKFYSEFLGWNTEVAPMGDMGDYTLCLQGEAMIGGIMAMPPMVPEGTPSNWGSYINVNNVDETHAKATELGAQTIMPPMDIPTVGRFATMTDTNGAVFSIIGPSEEVPPKDGPLRDTKANGSFCWHEIMSPDAQKTVEFYTALFGWTTFEIPSGESDGKPFTYIIFLNNGKHTGGIVQMSSEECANVPPHWGRYLRVENTDQALVRIEELGGKKCHDAFDIPQWGRIAFATDPSGAAFGVFQGVDGH